MSPGSVTEKLYFFIAEYSADDRRGEGGGLAAEGEDIEVLEWPLARALQAIREGEIVDAKTIMLLQHLALRFRRAIAPDETRRDNPLVQFAGDSAVHQRGFQRLGVKRRFGLRPG